MSASPSSSPYGSPSTRLADLDDEAGPSDIHRARRSASRATSPPIDTVFGASSRDESGDERSGSHGDEELHRQDNARPGTKGKAKGRERDISRLSTQQKGARPKANSKTNGLLLRIPRQGGGSQSETEAYDEDQLPSGLNADTDDGRADDEEFVYRSMNHETTSERVRRGWETRRAKKKARLDRGEEMIHTAVHRALSGINNISHDHIGTPLPTSELLLAIHHHASSLYTTQSMLFQPLKKGRKNPWGSKKRILLVQDRHHRNGGTDQRRTDSAGGGEDDTECRLQSQDESVHGDVDESMEVNLVKIKQENVYTDQYGELINYDRPDQDKQNHKTISDRNRSRLQRLVEGNGGGTSDGNGAEVGDEDEDEDEDDRDADKERTRSKGRYKVKDMYRAIDGQGLMALGILVQEHIIKTLLAAGYRRPAPTNQTRAVPRPSVQPHSGSSPKSKPKSSSRSKSTSATFTKRNTKSSSERQSNHKNKKRKAVEDSDSGNGAQHGDRDREKGVDEYAERDNPHSDSDSGDSFLQHQIRDDI